MFARFQDLVGHSTPILTNAIYADLSPVYQDAVNAIPLEDLDQTVMRRLRAVPAEPLPDATPATPEHPTTDTAPTDPSGNT